MLPNRTKGISLTPYRRLVDGWKSSFQSCPELFAPMFLGTFEIQFTIVTLHACTKVS